MNALISTIYASFDLLFEKIVIWLNQSSKNSFDIEEEQITIRNRRNLKKDFVVCDFAEKDRIKSRKINYSFETAFTNDRHPSYTFFHFCLNETQSHLLWLFVMRLSESGLGFIVIEKTNTKT